MGQERSVNTAETKKRFPSNQLMQSIFTDA